jgi:hypothetical protein
MSELKEEREAAARRATLATLAALRTLATLQTVPDTVKDGHHDPTFVRVGIKSEGRKGRSLATLRPCACDPATLTR